MAARSTLRSVGAGESAAAPKKSKTVAEAAATGDHRQLLVAMRERIARTVSNPDCPPRDLAALTRRLQDVAKEIESMDLRAREEGADAADVVEDEACDSQAF